jgi:hypothetical protein
VEDLQTKVAVLEKQVTNIGQLEPSNQKKQEDLQKRLAALESQVSNLGKQETSSQMKEVKPDKQPV